MHQDTERLFQGASISIIPMASTRHDQWRSWGAEGPSAEACDGPPIVTKHFNSFALSSYRPI